jgi:MFS family permease
MSNGLFLAAFACSGLASLIYQTTWTRLLTLYMGHSTAAASTVLAAFIGGLGGGAALGGYVARRLSPRRSLDAYVGLEAVVVLAAIALPFALEGLIPLLAWAYQDGTSPVIFPAARLVSCFVLVSIPALALGATLPMAVRWFAAAAAHAGRATGALYAANTAGATAGVLLAGFVTFPAIGISGTTGLGILASALAIAGVVVVARRSERRGLSAPHAGQSGLPEPTRRTPRRADRSQQPPRSPERRRAEQPWLAAMVLGITGLSTMVYEIVWIRVLTLITGPLWGRKAWGVWWTWDPRLTTTFILWLIYSGYFLIRNSQEDAHRRARMGAVLTILGMLDLPLVFMATRWFRGIHPVSQGMEPAMRVALLVSLAGFTALFVVLLILRKDQLRQAHLLSTWETDFETQASVWQE